MKKSNDSPRLNPSQRHETILNLNQQGVSIREIARTLQLSRNTVRKALRGEEESIADDASPHPIVEHLPALYHQARGNGVRIQEMASELHGIEITYSTLTRMLRNSDLRKPASKRSGTYHFEPGAEMHHDTSPHVVVIGGKKVLAQCAGAVLPVSRYGFIQYYPCFTRFEFQVFLTETICFFEGATARCTIDNTSVALAFGSGKEAIISPGIEAFGHHFGMTFIPHAVNHPDRKAHVERLFHYVEGNFIPGRSFDSWSDLNQQARQWCDYASSKLNPTLRVTPQITPKNREKACFSKK